MVRDLARRIHRQIGVTRYPSIDCVEPSLIQQSALVPTLI
jgi:hypothetical protein